MTSPWVPQELINAAKMFDRITDPLNKKNGIVLAADSSQYPPAPYVGQYVHDAAKDRLYHWSGTGWKLANKDTILAPVASAVIAGGTNAVAVTANYGKTFSSLPGLAPSVIQSSNVSIQTFNETTSSCTIRLYTTSGANLGSATSIAYRLVIIDPEWFT